MVESKPLKKCMKKCINHYFYYEREKVRINIEKTSNQMKEMTMAGNAHFIFCLSHETALFLFYAFLKPRVYGLLHSSVVIF